MYNLNTVHKTVNNLILPTTVIFCLTFGLYYKLDLLVPLVQANVPKVADFPFRNRVKSQVVANATNTYLDVPYINQCKDFENSPLWPDAIGSTAGRKICENMCGAASSVMLLSYFGNYPNDPNNPRVLRNRMTDSRPEITDEQRDGNASFGGAFAVTSKGMGNQSDGNNIVSLFNRYRYMSINSSGNEINNIDGNGYKFFYEQTSSSLIYNRVKIAIDRGNPVIVSTARHIRLVIGYDNQGKIIANDPWNNNSRTNNEIVSLDGKFVKYGSNIKLLGQSDPKIYDEWRWTLEFTPTKPPDVKQFVHGQRVKAFQKFSDDPI